MGPSTIGGSNFPITIALVGWSGFSFDLFDSTYPDSLFISHDCVCACACALSCPNIEATGHRWIWLVDHDKAERSQRGIALRCENLRHQGGRKRSMKVKMQSLVPNTYPCQPHTVNLVSHGQFGSKFLQGQSQQPDQT